MLQRPGGCRGCPLDEISTGFMRPSLSTGVLQHPLILGHKSEFTKSIQESRSGSESLFREVSGDGLERQPSLQLLHHPPSQYGVALVGEALGESEADAGSPFCGRAGFKLSRLIEWAGLKREQFDIWNVCWCRPPDNVLEGTPFEFNAINHCRAAHWGALIKRVNVVVPMGNVALHAFTGRKGILRERGYISSTVGSGYHLLPTVHPSFIQRGQSKYSAAFIHDLQKAVSLSASGLRFDRTEYTLDPSPSVAFKWAQDYRERLHTSIDLGQPLRLAYDIETPGKGDDEGALEDDDPTFFIWRIGFSYSPLHALSVPWTPEYIPAIKLLLESSGEKVVWNASFDNPRIRHGGVGINGIIHDGMVAWHILHSDLPKGLGFVATFTCPFQPSWKHLSHQQPAFYNATDADVELRSFLAIEEELIKCGLWEVYQRDVLDLEPILIHMSQMGMPLNPARREEKARELAARQALTYSQMEVCIPLEARRIDIVYIKEPKDKTGLRSRPGSRVESACSNCGLARPRADHFKRFVKKVNLCADAGKVERVIDVVEWFRLGDFKPSRDQLIRYQRTLGRIIPTTWDKKTKSRKPTMDEKAIKGLMLKYPLDPLYPLVLQYRELDKIAGTYIGRPSDEKVD